MNITYVLIRPESSIGVLKKIRAQLEYLNRTPNVNIQCIIYYSTGEKAYIPIIKKHIGKYTKCIYIETSSLPIIKQIQYLHRVYAHLSRHIEMNNPDIVYMRGCIAEWNLFETVKKHPHIFVFELNSIRSSELLLNHDYIKYLLDLSYTGKILNHAIGCISVTKEIQNHYKKICESNMVHFATVSNGFDVTSVPKRTPPSFDGKTIELLFVGNVSLWHGVDRIMNGMALYNGKAIITLHIIGAGEQLDHIKSLIDRLHLADRVKLYGNIYGKELDTMFDQCHAAIATLGIHRKKLKEACTLKVREYLARGIPFVLSDTDVDLVTNMQVKQYYHSCPQNNEPIKISKVHGFVKRVYESQNHEETMRNIAKNTVSMEIKISEMVHFLLTIKK